MTVYGELLGRGLEQLEASARRGLRRFIIAVVLFAIVDATAICTLLYLLLSRK